MVEIERSILAKQCLDRPISDFETLKTEVRAWVKERNAKQATLNWQFTKAMARDKFQRFYPKLS